MQKTAKLVIVTAALAVLSLFLVPLAGSCRGTEVAEMKDPQIPPLDAHRPAVTETATFSLG